MVTKIKIIPAKILPNHIDILIRKANAQLIAAKVAIKLELRGNRLYLRGSFPNFLRPDGTTTKPNKIALGLYPTKEGIERAVAIALQIRAEITLEKFCWSKYRKISESTKSEPRIFTAATIVEKFEEDYFNLRGNSKKTHETFKTEYLRIFNKLDLTIPLTLEELKNVVLTTEANTRARKRYAHACAALARFAELEDSELKRLAGSYSTTSLTPRQIPTDEEILSLWKQIPSQEDQFLFGLLATYGLRPHEFFLSSLQNPPYLYISSEGKTQQRLVSPLWPDWYEIFQLENIQDPFIRNDWISKSNSQRGSLIGKRFKKCNIPLKPYDLRHAWAIRSLFFGLDISLAAQQMGHGVQVHSQTYHLWISDQRHKEEFEKLKNKHSKDSLK